MTTEYSIETCKKLAAAFEKADLLRPLRAGAYHVGDEITYDVTGVWPKTKATVKLRVEKFVGGGFAGQVYRVCVTDIDAPDGQIDGLEIGQTYAIKILVPPSAGAEKFRNIIYAAGFQGPFQLQSNPAAARAGALWQKFIRRAAKIHFGSERAVVDILATFVDSRLGSCGEISEWVRGRTWRFEVDDRLDMRRKWRVGDADDHLGSPEYRAKKTFMAEFVNLLHEVGAHEFARQYEWSTCKSQPNALKRLDCEGDPAAGLTAVDFRAGLALLPLLPMSPGDFALIAKGLARGSLVQFDRGDLAKLARYVDKHPDDFADMADALPDLHAAEKTYRNSLPDITHNHVRLLCKPSLWRTMLQSAVTGWKVRGIADDHAAGALGASRPATLLFALAGLIPLLSLAGGVTAFCLLLGAMPWYAAAGGGLGVTVIGTGIGRLVRRLWGRSDYRKHYARMLASPGYMVRAIRGRMAESLIKWHRAGRISADRAEKLCSRPLQFTMHLPLSALPAGLHRSLIDWAFLGEKLAYIFVRPVRLYFSSEAREQWLRDMLAEGRKNGMLSDEDYATIESRISEPFIQKYLKSLAVHVCTLPITQVVSVCVALWYKYSHGLSWGEAWGEMLLIIGFFQIIPISPGSLVRGLYVLYLVIRERNYKDYNIAVFLGFFKYVGYLAFPIQMAYHYPALARFMAGHWATGAVHVVPVFGESGALLEHFVFDLFYNYPLTVRRRMRAWAEKRKTMQSRMWHVPLCAAGAIGLWAGMDYLYATSLDAAPTLKALWAAAVFPALLAGMALSRFAGGANMAARVRWAAVCGAVIGLGSAAVNLGVIHTVFPSAAEAIAAVTSTDASGQGASVLRYSLLTAAWRTFWFTLVCVVGALLAEITRAAPQKK